MPFATQAKCHPLILIMQVPLTESVLLGGIATRFPNQTLTWDAEKLSFKGNEKATELISRKYREGWEMDGLG